MITLLDAFRLANDSVFASFLMQTLLLTDDTFKNTFIDIYFALQQLTGDEADEASECAYPLVGLVFYFHKHVRLLLRSSFTYSIERA